MRVLTVIGSRPQFVKAAAVSRLLRADHDELLINTGQHYDDELSTIFVTELGIPKPDLDLALGGGSNTEQTAAMLAAIAPVMDEHQPDAVLVYGDTNSTLSGGLAAAQAGITTPHRQSLPALRAALPNPMLAAVAVRQAQTARHPQPAQPAPLATLAAQAQVAAAAAPRSRPQPLALLAVREALRAVAAVAVAAA